MYCIKCGTEIEKGSRFCPMCGALQEAAGSTKKTGTAKQESAARRNEKTAGNRSSAANRRPASEGKKAQSSRKAAAPKPAAPQKKSSAGSLTVVIISIFAIAAAAAAIFFVWSRTKENREDLVETTVVSESRNEDRETGEGGDKIKELFGLNKEETQEESAETAGEEPQDVQETETPEEGTQTRPEEEPAETTEVSETPEVTQEPTQTPTPEPIVTAEVKKASKVSLSGYKKVSVSHAAATSELKQLDQPDIDNSANSAVDGNVITSWQEDVKGYGEGEYLDFRLNTEYKIRAITFNMGNWRTEELYNDNSRPKDITIWLDQKSFHVTIPDGMTQYCVEFSGAVKASEVMVVVDSVYAGRQYDDTCISEITMYAE